MGETKKPDICNRVMRGTGMGASDLYAIIKGYCAQFDRPQEAKPEAKADPKAQAEKAAEKARAQHQRLKKITDPITCIRGSGIGASEMYADCLARQSAGQVNTGPRK